MHKRGILPFLVWLLALTISLSPDDPGREKTWDRAWDLGRAAFFERLKAGASRMAEGDDRDALVDGPAGLRGVYDHLMSFYFYLGDLSPDAPDFEARCVDLSVRMADAFLTSLESLDAWPPGASRLKAVLASAGFYANNDYPFYKNFLRKRTGKSKWNWAVEEMKLRGVHRLSQGDGIKVAIIDSGVDATIREIRDRTAGWRNVLDGRLPPWAGGRFPHDRVGHGTMIATLAHETAPRARLLFVKVVDPSTLDGPPVTIWSVSLVAAGLVWAADNGADVISLSLAFPWDAAPLRRAARYCWERNVVVIAAQGNTTNGGDEVRDCYPAAYPECLAVSGIERSANDLRPWAFSVRAPYIDVAAPACDLWSDWPSNLSVRPSARPALGNSFAAPIVAGAAALMISAMDPGLRAELRARPGRLVETVRGVLRRTAANERFGLPTPNDRTGYGMIDIESALKAVASAVAETTDGAGRDAD
ncbi:MAG: S8 family serine peptidase [Candidatus Aminicenantes bacterium]|nr:S8 family serine peptidase [Candidatus Aminicenantes bacterium]